MKQPLLLPLPGNEAMTGALSRALACDVGRIETRRFPDGETFVRIVAEPKDRDVILVCALDHPDTKLLPLVFSADAARELGASRVGLAAPYLAYLRQDRRFQAGEAVTSHSFARLLSGSLDWLATIDPHLHRYKSLAELYSIPVRALHAAPLLADWIGKHVQAPVLVGPDAESEQWVSAAAARIAVPFTVLVKTRTGDRVVSVALRNPQVIRGRTPVILDDIVSSGETMLAAIRTVRNVSKAPAVCMAVHGIFAEDANAKIAGEGARLVTCNTIPHATNAIDVSELLAAGVTELLRGK